MRASLVNHVSAFALAAVATMGIAGSDSARAGILFTFDDVKNASGSTVVSGISDGSSNGSIQTYMNNVIDLTNASYGVVVLSNSSMGARGEKDYSGDSHVVGVRETYTSRGTTHTGDIPGGSYPMEGNHVVPLTLGNTDGLVENGTTSMASQLSQPWAWNTSKTKGHLTTLDAYIKNDSSKTTIGLQFTGDMLVNVLDFDFQIFPDFTCPTASCGSDLPDLTLKYKDEDGVIHTVTQFFGETPDGDTHSPDSGWGDTELTPQLLSHATFLLPEAAKEVYFVDWPVTIGIDNLYVDYVPPPRITTAPEPMTGALLLSGLGGLLLARRRRART